jgi:hypothetical protein
MCAVVVDAGRWSYADRLLLARSSRVAELGAWFLLRYPSQVVLTDHAFSVLMFKYLALLYPHIQISCKLASAGDTGAEMTCDEDAFH